MDRLILVLETLGAWLLFGAPLLQATTELHEEVAGWEKIRSKHAAAKKIDIGKVTFWWWLLPPLKVLFEKRRIRKIQRTYADIKLSDETQERLYISKSSCSLLQCSHLAIYHSLINPRFLSYNCEVNLYQVNKL